MNPDILRVIFFITGFLVFSILETIFSFRRERLLSQKIPNIILTLINSGVMKLLIFFFLYRFVGFIEQSDFGLFRYLKVSGPISSLSFFLILDLIIYWQHRLFHVVPIFWRLHKVHHSDEAFDTSTALRFHFLEILFSYLIKLMAVFLLGAPLIYLVYFEMILNFSAMFNHSNFRLPPSIENKLRYLIVTPSFHRVHHSVYKNETNSNYGFCLSLWDYFFKSFVDYRQMDQSKMDIGLERQASGSSLGIVELITLPFSKNGK